MDLRQLKTLATVAELGSLSAAARELRIAQPALGRQIKMLEDEVGAAVFVRHTRGMTTTEVGEMLVTHAKAIQKQIDRAHSDVRSALGAVSGHIALGLPPALAEILLTGLVERFLGLYPDVSVGLASGFSTHLRNWFDRGELDLALLYETYLEGEKRGPQSNATPLWEERLFAVGPADAAMDMETPMSLADLLQKNLILAGKNYGLREQITRMADELGICLKVRIEIESLAIQKKLVRRGVGFALLPLHAVRAELEAGSLTAAPLVEPSILRNLSLYVPPDRPMSIASKILSSVLIDEIEALLLSGEIAGQSLIKRSP